MFEMIFVEMVIVSEKLYKKEDDPYPTLSKGDRCSCVDRRDISFTELYSHSHSVVSGSEISIG
ncbi:hypothetical protein L1S32_03950 [Methanogenium sp. S4BF]|uniref:hypothetical protein n=1 Tax=Methanogenium sp. S4BF TaxID=1789226 RepID=UPI0024170B37|nr:hypothetical protein [Methanogenium sp. S4BF]WFN35282.1 hypothetical protein L1S32_03950 [Methanogenium sp. S4BF]